MRKSPIARSASDRRLIAECLPAAGINAAAENRDGTSEWQHRIGYMICSKEAGESRANYIAADCADNKLNDEIDSMPEVNSS